MINEIKEDTTDLETIEVVEVERPEKSPFDAIPVGAVSIDDYAESLNETPKQAYERSDEETSEETGEKSENTNETQSANANAKANSDLIVSLFDDVASFGLSVYAGEENGDLYRAKESQKKALKDNLRRYLETQKEFELSPIWGVIIIAFMAYMPVVRQAAIKGKNKKLVKERVELEKQKISQQQAQQNRANRNHDLSAFGSSLESFDQEENEPIVTIIESPKSKTLKNCDYCGKPHKNKRYCSNECSVNDLNVKIKARK